MSKSSANAKAATIKLSDTQRVMLSVAAQSEDRCLTRPASLRGAQIGKLSGALIAAGYAREVMAKAAAPVWRRDGETGAAFALKLTAAGVKAIASDGTPPTSEVPAEIGDAPDLTKPAASPDGATGKRAARGPASSPVPARSEPRPTSKIAAVIGLLSRAGGATLAELISATDWLPHTTRAALTGLRKRGYVLILDRTDRQRGSVYQITSRPDRDAPRSTEIAAEAA
jgi:DNA-binding IclR family transcriptional regulator